MSDEWLQQIHDTLADSLGTNEQKRVAMQAARDLDATLRTRWPDQSTEAAAPRQLRAWFSTWIHQMRYLVVMSALDHLLPPSVTDPSVRTDADLSSDYGITTQAGIRSKRDQIGLAKLSRVERCTTHLREGWPEEACIGFVAARDEWQEARQNAGRR
jgi:hypothetical protein